MMFYLKYFNTHKRKNKIRNMTMKIHNNRIK